MIVIILSYNPFKLFFMRRVLNLIAIIVILCSCQKTSNKQRNYKKVVYDSLLLQQNIKILGDITSIDFFIDQSFVITSQKSRSIYFYNSKGEQFKVLNTIGKGPFEYINPTIIKINEDKVYVWCSELLKLIVFDREGKPINEHGRFKNAIKDFDVYSDKLYMYLAGGSNKTILEYDLNSNSTINYFGNVSEEHKLLNIISSSGAIAINQSIPYFTTTDSLNIYSINKNASLQCYKIHDENFKVNKVKDKSDDIINNNKHLLFDYLNNNSVVMGLYSSERGMLLEFEFGKYSIKNNRVNLSDRYIKFIWFDNKFIKSKELILKKTNDYIHVNKDGELVAIESVLSEMTLNFYLKKISHNE